MQRAMQRSERIFENQCLTRVSLSDMSSKDKTRSYFFLPTANSMGAEEFGYAIERVWELPESPDNMEKLELYK